MSGSFGVISCEETRLCLLFSRLPPRKTRFNPNTSTNRGVILVILPESRHTRKCAMGDGIRFRILFPKTEVSVGFASHFLVIGILKACSQSQASSLVVSRTHTVGC
jgi:hypothetical protein